MQPGGGAGATISLPLGNASGPAKAIKASALHAQKPTNRRVKDFIGGHLSQERPLLVKGKNNGFSPRLSPPSDRPYVNLPRSEQTDLGGRKRQFRLTLKFVIQTGANDVAGRLAIEPEPISKRGDIAGFNSAEILPVESEMKIFRFHGPMTAEPVRQTTEIRTN